MNKARTFRHQSAGGEGGLRLLGTGQNSNDLNSD